MLRLMFTRRWLVRLVFVMLMVAVFLGLGWWQWQRGAAGNARSIAYAFEWPVFAAFLVFMWWKMLRLEATTPPDDAAPAQPGSDGGAGTGLLRARQYVPRAQDEEPDEELAEYNRYLAWLNTRDQQRQK